MKKIDLTFQQIEPLKSNRWVIETFPLKINYFLFRNYKMYNEGEKIIFETKFLETILDSYNPKDLMEITDITLMYLSPIGEIINGYKMIVSGVNFEKKHSYKSDKLLTTKLRFVIDQISLMYKQEKKEIKNGTN